MKKVALIIGAGDAIGAAIAKKFADRGLTVCATRRTEEKIKKLTDEINNSGGKLEKTASGVAPEEVVKSISYGICKINIATDTRILWARIHREFFKDNPDQFDPIIPGKQYIEAYEKFMINKFDLLKATGKANQFN